MSRREYIFFFFFFQAEDGIRDLIVTGVQTCALPILQVRARISRNTYVIEVVRGDTASLETVANRLGRKPGKVLDPTEALFFGRGDELPISDEACRRAAVVGVDSENVHKREGRGNGSGRRGVGA